MNPNNYALLLVISNSCPGSADLPATENTGRGLNVGADNLERVSERFATLHDNSTVTPFDLDRRSTDSAAVTAPCCASTKKAAAASC